MTTNLNGFVIFGAIEEKWLTFGGQRSALGKPLSNETPTFDAVGRFQQFESGIISWHPDIGAHIVWGLIGARWLEIGREQFGYPITDESVTPDERGRFNHFRALHLRGKPESSIYWMQDTGAHEITGAIRAKWAEMGWEKGPLGYPVNAVTPTFDHVGCYQDFQAGAMCWHPETGPHAILGVICSRWREIGQAQFGYPITDESVTPDQRGRYNHFKGLQWPDKPESSIYWTQETGAYEVTGAIRAKWAEMGWERSPLGYPVNAVNPTFDHVGCYQDFQAGAMCWHPETGPHAVLGLICSRWREIGQAQFGYPTTDESITPDGRGHYNHFRALQLPDKPESSIYWTQQTGAHEVYGAIRERWAKRGWEGSNLGYPVDAERDRSDAPGREQRFEKGRIVWAGDTGALFDPLIFTTTLVTGGLAALGGSVTITVNIDGSVRWQGHAHDSGADGYEFGIGAVIQTPSQRALALAHSGSVGGTFTSGSSDHDWDETQAPNPFILGILSDINDGNLETHLEYSSDIGTAFAGAFDWLLRFSIGGNITPFGAMIIFIGVEVGSFIGTGSGVPGARIEEGFLWMAGPGNTLFAIISEGVASLGSQTRELYEEEYKWANDQVFLGALPPRDQIMLTDTIGGGSRAFTFPRWDGKITLNMGGGAFNDPRNYMPGTFGQIFIHELVHACQIYHKTHLGYLAGALAVKACEISTSPYAYGPAGGDYHDLNIEQQAQIVSDWFAGVIPQGTNQSGIAKDINSPYFRYVNDVRAGHF